MIYKPERIVQSKFQTLTTISDDSLVSKENKCTDEGKKEEMREKEEKETELGGTVKRDTIKVKKV